jgi:hypothetical protein
MLSMKNSIFLSVVLAVIIGTIIPVKAASTTGLTTQQDVGIAYALNKKLFFGGVKTYELISLSYVKPIVKVVFQIGQADTYTWFFVQRQYGWQILPIASLPINPSGGGRTWTNSARSEAIQYDASKLHIQIPKNIPRDIVNDRHVVFYNLRHTLPRHVVKP